MTVQTPSPPRASTLVAADQWPVYFDRLSRRLVGQPLTVQLFGGSIGLYTLALNLPLVGITVDPSHHQRAIEIITGDSPEAHLTHVIEKPLQVRILHAEGDESAIQIRSDFGTTVLLTFEGSIPDN